MGSCREMCRRVFRGLLVIPGCKTVCYKCILPPCYYQNESDDEKDDKDDEGYDSCGNAPMDSHVPESSDIPLRTIVNTTSHDYVNQTDYTNLPPVDPENSNKSCENLYVTMTLDSIDHLEVSQQELQNRNRNRSDAHVHVAVANCSSDYVNTDGLQSTDKIDVNQTDVSSSKTCQAVQDERPKSVRNENKTTKEVDEMTSSVSVSCTDVGDIVHFVPSTAGEQDSNTKQTLVLLETDL